VHTKRRNSLALHREHGGVGQVAVLAHEPHAGVATEEVARAPFYASHHFTKTATTKMTSKALVSADDRDPTAMPKFMRSLVMWLGMLLSVTTPASSQTYFVQQPGIDFKTMAWHTQPLADDAPIDPNSAIMVQTLVMALHASQTTVYSFSDMPVYIVPANQPTVRVVTACDPGPPCDLLQQQFNAVPMPYPNRFVTQGGSDHEAVIYRRHTHEMWEGWLWQRTGRMTTNSLGRRVPEWQVTWGGYAAHMRTNPGWWRTDPVTGQKPGMVATGIPWIAFGVTIGDLLQQHIDHAIGIIIPVHYARAGTWNQPPAQRTDGVEFGDQYIPEGAIFRLPPDIDLDAYPATAWDGVSPKSVFRLYAEAMRDYGCVVYDQGGTAIFMSEAGATPHYPVDPYTTEPLATIQGAGDIAVDDFPWSQLQVLQMNLARE